MKKVLVTAAAIGLIAVPSIALASRSQGNNQNPATTANKANQKNEVENEAENEQENEAENEPANQANNQDNDNNDEVTTPAQGSTTAISEAQARTIAQNQMPGKTIKKIEKETENNKTVFSVRFTDGSRVDVEATSGTVVRKENRNDKNEDHSGPGRNGNGVNSNRGPGNSNDR